MFPDELWSETCAIVIFMSELVYRSNKKRVEKMQVVLILQKISFFRLPNQEFWGRFGMMISWILVWKEYIGGVETKGSLML